MKNYLTIKRIISRPFIGLLNFGQSNQLAKNFTLFAFFIAATISYGFAQTDTGDVSISIVDENDQPVEFAAVVLYKAEDESVAKIQLADVNGVALFEDIAYNRYFIKASFVGLEEKTSEVFQLNTAKLVVPNMKMKSTIVLDEVVVSTTRNLVERKLDRVVVNVGSSLTSQGGNLSDVLSVSPGVTVGNNGNISLRGKSGVIVLIDGRTSYLKGADLENYINSMPASQFSNIEIMTNPPAKYDAEGNAGIINIITKRSTQKGWNLDYSSSFKQGRFSEINNSLGWTVNDRKISFFGNVSYTDQNNFDEYLIDRNFRDENGDVESIFEQNTFIRRDNKILNGRLGLDFFPSDKTTIGFLVSGQKTDGASTTDNTTLLRDGDGNLVTTLIAPATNNADYENLQSNVHLTHKFNDAGQEVSVDVDYLKFDSRASQVFNNRFLDANGNQTAEELLDNRLPQEIEIFNAKFDWVQPLSENVRLDFGAKTSIVDTDNDAQFFENVEGELIENTNLSNLFRYSENVNAGYLNYVQKIDQLSIQAGIRVEQTSIEGDQVTQGTTFENDYTNVLPSLFLSYQLDEETQVGLSYGRRLQRPNYKDLNPFRYFYDRFTFEEGNPNLTPQFSDNIELNYSIWGGALTTTAYYNKTTDVITEAIFQNTDLNETFVRKENLSDLTSYGLGLNADVPLSKKWVLSMNLNYSRNNLGGVVAQEDFTIKANTFSAFMLHQYKFAKSWAFELGGWYTSQSISDTFIQDPYGRLAVAIGKTLWDGKGKLRLSGNDVFGWTNFNARSGFPNTDVRVRNTWQTRTVRLAFTYKIGSGQRKKRADRKSSVEGEAERLDTYGQ